MASTKKKLHNYYITAVFSLIFAIVGFSYNAWRLEVSEDNSSIRTASFAVINELAQLEQLVYAAHYDKDLILGNPRNGWIKVGLINDLSTLIAPNVQAKSEQLKLVWQEHWEQMAESNQSTSKIITAIDNVRMEIKDVINQLD